jgi:hypothetical protein
MVNIDGRTLGILLCTIVNLVIFVAFDPLSITARRATGDAVASKVAKEVPFDNAALVKAAAVAGKVADQAADKAAGTPASAAKAAADDDDKPDKPAAPSTDYRPKKVAVAGDAGGGGGDAGQAGQAADAWMNNQHCFRRRLFWSPTICSRLPMVLKKLAAVHPKADKWSLLHIGNRDELYKVGELLDVFAERHPFGTLETGIRAMGNKKSARVLSRAMGSSEGKPVACGACCECSQVDIETVAQKVDANATAYSLTAFVPQRAGLTEELSTYATVQPFPKETLEKCPSGALAAAKAHLASTPANIITIDAGACDAELVRAHVVAVTADAKQRATLLQFTMQGVSENYGAIAAKLEAAKYHCFFPTSKPQNRNFRGVRAPTFPMFVTLPGCWRPIFDNFHGERYHMMCVDTGDEVAMEVMKGFRRATHMGKSHGCALGPASSRLKSLQEHIKTAAKKA